MLRKECLKQVQKCPKARLLSRCFKLRFDGFYQCVRFLRCADGNAEVLPDRRLIEPTHKDSSPTEFLEPALRRINWRSGQNKVGLAGKDFKTKHGQFATQLLAGGDDFPKIIPVIG